MTKELNERLDKQLSKVKINEEDLSSEIKKVEGFIKSGNLTDYEKKLAKALLDCCKTGTFKSSSNLDKALVDFAVDAAQDSESDSDLSDLPDQLSNVCLEDDWEEAYLADSIGYAAAAGQYKPIGYSIENAKLAIDSAWSKGVQYCQDQGKKVYNKALPIVKKIVAKGYVD